MTIGNLLPWPIISLDDNFGYIREYVKKQSTRTESNKLEQMTKIKYEEFIVLMLKYETI